MLQKGDLPPIWPPIWLIGFATLAWAQSRWFDAGLGLGGIWADFAGGVLLGGGVVLTVLAASEFYRHKTTIIPHNMPSRLIQSGIFSRTRNPIYLADLMILTGLILRWDAVLSLPLIPVFLWILEKRFILPEETLMRQAFGAAYAQYERSVGRWI